MTIDEILNIAGVGSKVKIIDLGVWRHPNYRNSGGLAPHKSVDWYVDQWFDQRRGQVDVSKSIRQLIVDPWNEENPHYDLILTARDLYIQGTEFVVGYACPRRGAIISLNRFRNIDEAKKQSLIFV